MSETRGVVDVTWHEFKSKVDIAILEAGMTEAVEIEYIDTGAFPDEVDIFVHPFESYVLPPEKWKTTLAVQG